MIPNIRLRTVVGANIRELREMARMPVEDCAAKLGVHRTYWYQMEKGKLNFTIDKLSKVASFFKVRVEDLVVTRPARRQKEWAFEAWKRK